MMMEKVQAERVQIGESPFPNHSLDTIPKLWRWCLLVIISALYVDINRLLWLSRVSYPIQATVVSFSENTTF